MHSIQDQEIILDQPALLKRKALLQRSLYVRGIPKRRVIGYTLVLIGCWLHQIALPTAVSLHDILIYGGIVILYNIITFLIVLLLKRDHRLPIAGDFFLLLDQILFTAAIYVTGDVKSLFFVLLIIRTSDHVFVSFKKAVFYNHYAILLYIGMLIYLRVCDEQLVYWPVEILKVIIAYSINWYIGAVAKMGDKLKARMKATINTTKAELAKRIEAEEKQKKTNERLNQANAELRHSLDQVKTLQGLLPICARCKKIRDEEGYWKQIEEYIEDRSDAQFSHGICESCAKELYGNKPWYKGLKSKE